MSKEGYLALKKVLERRSNRMVGKVLKDIDIYFGIKREKSKEDDKLLTIEPQVLERLKGIIRQDIFSEESFLKQDLRFFCVEVLKQVIYVEEKEGKKDGKKDRGSKKGNN